jgi:hypothetical protein
MHEIAAEQVRELNACRHLADPKPHILRHGCDPREAVAYAKGLAQQAVDARGRRLRCDAPIILAGVISWPEPLAACLNHPEAMARWVAFRDDSIVWICQHWGDHLKSAVEHVDEDQPHIQFTVVTKLDPDQRLRLSSIHPGLQAAEEAARRGASRRDQKKAYQAAMRQFQDTFYFDVASRHGLTRFGARRQRVKREEWKAQKEAAKALAEAGRRQREEALKLVKQAELRTNEALALAKQSAQAEIAAAKADAEGQVRTVKNKAQNYARSVSAELAKMQHELGERNATICAQEEQIEELQALLREHGIVPIPSRS